MCLYIFAIKSTLTVAVYLGFSIEIVQMNIFSSSGFRQNMMLFFAAVKRNLVKKKKQIKYDDFIIIFLMNISSDI